MALDADLQEKKNNLSEFVFLTKSILNYLPAVITNQKDKGDYRIYLNEQAGVRKFIRPINLKFFVHDSNDFEVKYQAFLTILLRIKNGERNFSNDELLVIDQTLYTIQQSIGAGLDLLVNPNSARKHVGNRFEELIKCVFTEIGVSNKKTVLQIPYETDEGQKVYKCENDLILSPFDKVKSTSKSLDKKEIVVSVKTTSKDRMGKMFIDKILLERFVKHDQKVIGIFLNDVQRKEEDNISFTLVSGLFMVYSNFLTELEGVYYLDPPPNAKKEPYNKYMKSFSNLITQDVWRLLAS
ncbi:MAG: hypothetical protein RIC30_03950 [Marinoscillum sp.]|uniref:hypothetical protein n=1 Tax=Marinoscillum sp. TaxID=2024838 RepID=UPI003301FADA